MRMAEDVADQLVGASERGVDFETDSDQASRAGVEQVVLLGQQTDDAAEDRLAADQALRVLLDHAGTDLDLVAHLQHPLQNGPSRHPPLQLLDVDARPVHVEAPDDDHLRTRAEVPDRNRNVRAQVLTNRVHVVLKLSRHWNYRAVLSLSVLHESLYLLVVLHRSLAVFEYYIDLVLYYYYMLQVHYLHRSQVLLRLRLRATHITFIYIYIYLYSIRRV